MCCKCGKQHGRFKSGKMKKTCPRRGRRGKGLKSWMKAVKKDGAKRRRGKGLYGKKKGQMVRRRRGRGMVNDKLVRAAKKYGRYMWRKFKTQRAAQQRKKRRGYI